MWELKKLYFPSHPSPWKHLDLIWPGDLICCLLVSITIWIHRHMCTATTLLLSTTKCSLKQPPNDICNLFCIFPQCCMCRHKKSQELHLKPYDHQIWYHGALEIWIWDTHLYRGSWILQHATCPENTEAATQPSLKSHGQLLTSLTFRWWNRETH